LLCEYAAVGGKENEGQATKRRRKECIWCLSRTELKLEFVAVEHVLAVHCLTLWGLHINSIRNTVQYRLYLLVGEVKVGLYSVWWCFEETFWWCDAALQITSSVSHWQICTIK